MAAVWSRSAGIAIASAILLLIAGCSDVQRARREVLVTVIAPDGSEFSGSSIMDLSSYKAASLGAGGHMVTHITTRGQATIVRIKGHVPIFVLLSRGTDVEFMCCVYVASFSSPGGQKPYFATLDSSFYPDIVSFKDIDDPKSIFLINPENFYGGYRIKSISVQDNDDAHVSDDIFGVLPWLDGLKGSISKGRINNSDPKTFVSDYSFYQGIDP